MAMNRFAPIAEHLVMTTATCCNRPMATVTIDTVRGALTLVECAHCEARRWYRAGEEVAISDLLSWAIRHPTRHLVAVAA